ncbi:hypothetical protein D3C86_2042880 [compost metagenome]
MELAIGIPLPSEIKALLGEIPSASTIAEPSDLEIINLLDVKAAPEFVPPLSIGNILGK